MLAGRKRVRLFPPGARHGLYPNGKYDSGTECCDVRTDDSLQYPLLEKIRHLGQEVVLGPGDVLYMPKFFFHEVATLETAVSVNIFTSSLLEDMTRGLIRRCLFWL